MSIGPNPAEPHESGPAKQPPGQAEQPERSEPAEQPQAQHAWDARRDLDAHAPHSMSFDGTNHGVTAQQIIGDIHQHYDFGGFRATHASGEIPQETLDRLADGFVTEGTGFEALVERLRLERILVLTGDPHTGRRTAALMLLRAVGAVPVQSVDRGAKPEDVVPGEHCGQVFFDLEPTRAHPLREAQLLAVRDRLRAKHSFMVITTGHSPYIEDTVRLASWQPPRRGPF